MRCWCAQNADDGRGLAEAPHRHVIKVVFDENYLWIMLHGTAAQLCSKFCTWFECLFLFEKLENYDKFLRIVGAVTIMQLQKFTYLAIYQIRRNTLHYFDSFTSSNQFNWYNKQLSTMLKYICVNNNTKMNTILIIRRYIILRQFLCDSAQNFTYYKLNVNSSYKLRGWAR